MDRCSSINLERGHDNIWRRRYAAADGIWCGVRQPSPPAQLWAQPGVLWEWELWLSERRTVSVRWGTAAGESLRPCRQASCLWLGFACFVQLSRLLFPCCKALFQFGSGAWNSFILQPTFDLSFSVGLSADLSFAYISKGSLSALFPSAYICISSLPSSEADMHCVGITPVHPSYALRMLTFEVSWSLAGDELLQIKGKSCVEALKTGCPSYTSQQQWCHSAV